MTETNLVARDDGAPPDDGAIVWIRYVGTQDRADEFALVLAATGLPYQVARSAEGGYLLGVPAGAAAAARRALQTYDAESKAASREAPPPPDRGTNALGAGVALGLVAFTMVTGYWEREPPSRWFTVGVADAALIRGGAWWRAITAMTLHANVMHLLGNVAATLIFIGAAGRWMGAGVAAVAILLAGTGANLLTAWTEPPSHLSAGASTATFAALGLVAGLQVVRRWRGGGAIRRRAWVAAGAGLALLAMLGMGAQADVYAHGYGLGLGTLLGVLVGAVDRPPPAPAPDALQPARARGWRAFAAQAVLVGAALAAVAAAWAHAWRLG